MPTDPMLLMLECVEALLHVRQGKEPDLDLDGLRARLISGADQMQGLRHETTEASTLLMAHQTHLLLERLVPAVDALKDGDAEAAEKAINDARAHAGFKTEE